MANLKQFITRETTQKDVAKDLGISPQTLSNYLNEKTQPDMAMLIKFADYFHTTIDNLLGHEVPYLLDKSVLTAKQRAIVDLLPEMSDRICEKVESYINGLLEGENDKIAAIQKFRN